MPQRAQEGVQVPPIEKRKDIAADEGSKIREKIKASVANRTDRSRKSDEKI